MSGIRFDRVEGSKPHGTMSVGPMSEDGRLPPEASADWDRAVSRIYNDKRRLAFGLMFTAHETGVEEESRRQLEGSMGMVGSPAQLIPALIELAVLIASDDREKQAIIMVGLMSAFGDVLKNGPEDYEMDNPSMSGEALLGMLGIPPVPKKG